MKNDELNFLFEKARNDKSVITQQKVLENFKGTVVQEKPTLSIQQKRVFGFMSLAATLTALIIINPSFFFNSKEIEVPIEESSRAYSIEKASLKRQAFLHQIRQSGNDPNSKVQILKSFNQPLLSEGVIPTLKVEPSILERLGFKFSPDEVTYEANVVNHGYLKYSLSKDTHSLYLNDNHSRDLDFATSIYPLFISDMRGYQKTKFAFGGEGSIWSKQKIAKNAIDDLVPIAIPNPENREEHIAILWFESSDNLFDLLTQKEIEFNAQIEIESDTKSFESQSGLSLLGNPFNRTLAFEFFLPESSEVSIDLVSIEGLRISPIVQKTRYEAGKHAISKDLLSIKSGIYILVLTTGTDRISKRILKK